MSAAPNTAASPSRASDGTQPRQYTPGLSDAIGDRLLTFDGATASSIELLRFKREFADTPGFEAALRKRIEVLGRVRHPSLATIRGVETSSDGLALASTHTAGRRLSEILIDARGAAFALELIRQVAPALAVLHQQGPDVAHGLLTPERIVVTREGRLVVVEQVLGSAFQALRLPAARLQTELGVAVRAGSQSGLDARGDVIQLGLIALSLLVGRRIEATDYPASVPALLDSFAAADPASAARLRPWLERALHLGEKPFANGQEASQGFSEVPEERQAQAPEPARQVLTFHKPAEGAAAGASKAPAAVAPASSAPEPETTPASGGGSKKLILWGAVAASIVVVGVGAVMAGAYFSGLGAGQPDVVVAPPATRVDVAAGIPQPAPTPAPIPATTVTPPPAAPAATPTDATGAPVAGARPGETTGTAETPEGGAPAAGGAPRFGGMRLTSTIDLQAFEGERLIGSTAGPIAITEGTHTIDLVNEELGFRARQNVVVRAGQMAAVTVAIPNGRLSVNAVPWAEVWIDGTAAGETPLANLSIAIGKHVIVFRHPQLGERTETVVVKAEGLTRASATFKDFQK